jgi:hypothetical protein
MITSREFWEKALADAKNELKRLEKSRNDIDAEINRFKKIIKQHEQGGEEIWGITSMDNKQQAKPISAPLSELSIKYAVLYILNNDDGDWDSNSIINEIISKRSRETSEKTIIEIISRMKNRDKYIVEAPDRSSLKITNKGRNALAEKVNKINKNVGAELST